MRKQMLNEHLRNVHGMVRCYKCFERFPTNREMEAHCIGSHPQVVCALCVGEKAFKCFAYKQLSAHIAKMHPEFYHCVDCGRKFSTCDAVQSHACSKAFSGADLQLLMFLRQPVNLSELEEKNIASALTDDEGLITSPIPSFPHQAVCSIDNSQNTTAKLQFDKFSPQYINQSQDLIQLGSSAIVMYCCEVNSPSCCTEVFEWKRTSAGGLLPKPRFDRTNVHFRRDENDVMFNRRSSRLSPPYQLGHIRAAANCLSLVDFKASFSNLNYWPQHEKLNTVQMRLLEEHIRNKAKAYSRVFITTGAIFVKDGRVVGNYCHGVYIPPAFYKVALFEDFSGKFEVFAWILQNDVSELSFAQCEVSLLLVEKATRMRFLTPDVLARVLPSSITRHVSELRRYDTYLGIR
jgi:hypothetical protein